MNLFPTHLHAWALGLGLLAATPLAAPAQVLTNAGTTLSVGTGTTLTVSGGYAQTGGALLQTAGTVRVSGLVQAAAGSTLDLSTGELNAAGDLSAAMATTTGTTGTLRLTGAANQTVSLGGGTVGQLVVNKPTPGGGRVDLPTDLTARTGVTLTAGLVRTAAGSTLSLPSGAVLTGEGPGQYVQGNLRVSRATGTGATAVDFGNGLVLVPNNQALGTATATRTAGLQTAGVSYGQNLAGTAKGIDRVWLLATAQAPTAPVSVTLSWLADDDNGFILATPAQLWRAAQPTGPWDKQGGAASASARSFTADVSQLGVLTVSSTSQPLPVELTAFAAERRGETAYLSWATASEKNSAYFEAETSLNGTAFRAVGRVAAQGNTAQRHDYELSDPRLTAYSAPVVYYRLRQVDLDGTVNYSPVRALAVAGQAAAFEAVAWPNPVGSAGLAQLLVRGPLSGQVLELTLTDAAGRVLARRSVAAEAAAGALALPETANLPAGVYWLGVRQGGARRVLRLLHE